MKTAKKLCAFCTRHYLLSPLLASVLAAAVCLLPLGHSPAILAAAPVLAPFCTYPLALTAVELILLLRPRIQPRHIARVYDLITLTLGVLYIPFYLMLVESVELKADWTMQLTNQSVHTPIFTQSVPTIVAVALVGLAGYVLLTYVPLEKLPPLWVVLGMAGMYLACGVGVLWCIQVLRDLEDLPLALLPLNVLLITARTVRDTGKQWLGLPERPSSRGMLGTWDRLLRNSTCWPVLAGVLMWPLLGILVALLALFGQAPNDIIRAWTETSDWNLSQQIAPQNLYYDQHYLCTVAAGGHPKLVRPLRRGVRHGHWVVVNRQLCIANAFEQVLEERTPRFHRRLRRFYDTYGFPIARLIRSPFAADTVYLLMKPLEWGFLAVLYLTDVHPEDRIAVQYTGKHVTELCPHWR